MFKNLKIGVRLGLGFGMVLLLLIVISVLSYMRVSEINDEIGNLVNDKYPKVTWATDMVRAMNQVAQINRNTLLVTDPAEIASQRARRDEQFKKIAELQKKLEETIKSDEGKKLLAAVTSAEAKYKVVLDKFSKANSTEGPKAAIAILYGEFRPVTDAYLNGLRDIIKYQDDLMKKSGKHTDDLASAVMNQILAMSLIAILIAAVAAWWITRSIVRPINEAVGVATSLAGGDLTVKVEVDSKDETGMLKQAMSDMVGKLSSIIGEVNTASEALNNAAGQVSQTAQSLSQSSSEQAASVEETTASIEQMTASINQNTENAKVTDGMASKSAVEAAEGGTAVKDTVEAMKQIAGKIGIIDDIAYQTNLLALNAAIEAARAGEHGKGFAVVAAEVRKLAERSQVAAQEIGQLAGSSVGMAEKAGKLLDTMVPSIRKTSDLVQEIAAASQEQSAGVGQINGAMGQLNKATQQNASASEELAATAEEMGGQSAQLTSLMSFFKVNDQQGSAPRPAARKQSGSAAGVTARAASRKAPAAAVNEQDFERF